jgi:hypothetical protein
MSACLVRAVLYGTFLFCACVLHQVKQQQEQLAAMCRISGSLSAPQEPANLLVVVLIRHDGTKREIVDHYVLERPGHFTFLVTPGNYGSPDVRVGS